MLLLVISLVIRTSICEAGNPYFKGVSQNETVDTGRNVTLTCNSSYATSACNHQLSWFYKNIGEEIGMKLVSCLNVKIDRFHERMTARITEESVQNRGYHIKLWDVQPEDSGQYWCSLIMEYGREYTSAKITLTVDRLLPTSPPSCEVDPLKFIKIGAIISLRCTLSNEDPPSLLTWFEKTSNGLGRQIEPTREAHQQRKTYSVKLVLNETDNMKEFTCVAGNDVSGPNCSLTPLQIPPTVTVSPSSVTLHEGQRATFTCLYEATPHATADEYRWRLQKQDNTDVKVSLSNLGNYEGQFNLGQRGQNFEILKVSTKEHNNSRVVCIAILRGESTRYMNDSELLVVAATTAPPRIYATTTLGMRKTTNDDDRDSDDELSDSSQSLSPGVIAGGVLAVTFLLVIILFLSCYLMKNKNNSEGSHMAQRPPGEDRRGTNIVRTPDISPTYEEPPQEATVHLSPPNNQASGEQEVKSQAVLYAAVDESRRGEIRHYTISSPANNTNHGTGQPSPSIMEKEGASSNPVIYAICHPTSRPDKASADGGKGDCSGVTGPEITGKQHKNVEGLVYADLDFNEPQVIKREEKQDGSGEQILYAKVRRDQ